MTLRVIIDATGQVSDAVLTGLERLRVVDDTEMTQSGLDALLASDHLRPAVKAQLEAEGLESED